MIIPQSDWSRIRPEGQKARIRPKPGYDQNSAQGLAEGGGSRGGFGICEARL